MNTQSPYKTYLNWSTGKDCAFALYLLQQDPNFHVDHLLTSFNAHHDRVSMHGLHRDLFLKQVEQLKLSYSTLELSEQPSMSEYDEQMKTCVDSLKNQGYTHAAFGDIFLEDLRKYREDKLASVDLKAVFPLWKKNTNELITEFIDLGFKAITVSCNAQLLDESFCGRIIDHDFVKDLPKQVDPCGENGEFHTFCFDGPIFQEAISFEIGEKIYREYDNPVKSTCHDANQPDKIGFWFSDLLCLN